MIYPPGWCAHAVPSLRGWRHPRTGELLKKRSISQAEIDQWNAEFGDKPTTLDPVHGTKDCGHSQACECEAVDNMTKLELEALGRIHGVELDRRKKKSSLLETIKELIFD